MVFVTGDTVAKWLARNFDIDYLEIPPEWLLPERPDPRDLENQELKKQLGELRSSEPKFAMTCVDQTDAELEQNRIDLPAVQTIG